MDIFFTLCYDISMQSVIKTRQTSAKFPLKINLIAQVDATDPENEGEFAIAIKEFEKAKRECGENLHAVAKLYRCGLSPWKKIGDGFLRLGANLLIAALGGFVCAYALGSIEETLWGAEKASEISAVLRNHLLGGTFGVYLLNLISKKIHVPE